MQSLQDLLTVLSIRFSIVKGFTGHPVSDKVCLRSLAHSVADRISLERTKQTAVHRQNPNLIRTITSFRPNGLPSAQKRACLDRFDWNAILPFLNRFRRPRG